MKFSRSILKPRFLKDLDQFLLKNYSIIWETRLHFIIFYFLCAFGLLMLASIIPLSKRNIPEYRSYRDFIIILIGLAFIIYCFYIYFQNHRKRFRLSHKGLYGLFFVYYFIIWLFATVIITSDILFCNKVKSVIDPSEQGFIINSFNAEKLYHYSDFKLKLWDYKETISNYETEPSTDSSLIAFIKALYIPYFEFVKPFFLESVKRSPNKGISYITGLKQELDTLNIFRRYYPTEEFVQKINTPGFIFYDSLYELRLDLFKIEKFKKFLNDYGYESAKYEYDNYPYFTKIASVYKFLNIERNRTIKNILLANLAAIYLSFLLLLMRIIKWKPFWLSLIISIGLSLFIILVSLKNGNPQIIVLKIISIVFYIYYIFQVLRICKLRKRRSYSLILLNVLNLILFLSFFWYSFIFSDIFSKTFKIDFKLGDTDYNALLLFNIISVIAVLLLPVIRKPYTKLVSVPKTT